MLCARLFGELQVEVDGRPVPPIPGLRPRAVLAYLLLNPGPHTRATLAPRFWPNVLDTSARASLRSALWVVRAALDEAGGGRYLAGDRDVVGIDRELPRSIDVEQFARLTAAADPALAEQAVALAAEPLLADLAEDWVLEARDEQRESVLAALELLAAAAEQAGDPGHAAELTRRALEQDRLREATHRALMRRLALAGEPARALVAYRRCRALLAAEFGIAPSAETRALADELRAQTAVPRAPAPLEPAGSSAPSPRPLRGREVELASLGGALDRAIDGTGSVVVISGPGGIGKSRLAEELGAIATARGATFAIGGSLEIESGPPFAAWSEAVRSLAEQSAPPEASRTWRTDLARLCPALEHRWALGDRPAATSPDIERARLFEAVAELVSWCSHETPLVILLEDLHWADPGTLALLSYVARGVTRLRALLVVTRRDSPPCPELDLALDGLERRGGVVERLALDPLGADVIGELVASASPSLAADRASAVVAASGGNPLFALAGSRAAALGGDPADGLRGAIRGPLGRLSQAERRLADLGAVSGRPFELGELSELMPPEAIGSAFDACVDAGLFDAGSPRSPQFVHDLVRRACYAEIPAGRRVQLHGELAAVLARRLAPAAETARHFRIAGDDAQARRHLIRAAADARALGAPESAHAFLREVLALPGATTLEQAEAWLALAEVEAWLERRPEMDAAFSEARERLGQAGDQVGLAAALVSRGSLLRVALCYPAESLVAYREALVVLERLPPAPELRALALAGAAWGESVAGDPALVEDLLAETARIPEVRDDAGLAVEVEFARTSALLRSERFAEAELAGEQAALRAKNAGRTDLFGLIFTNLAAAAVCRGDFARALEISERALAAPHTTPMLEGNAHAARAYALSRLGRHDEAQEEADRNVALAARFGQPDYEAAATFDRASVLLAGALFADAAEGFAAALVPGVGQFSRPVARLRRCEALVRSGALDEAAEELAQVPFEPVTPSDMPGTLVARLTHLEGTIAGARGETEAALRRLGEAEAMWRRLLVGTTRGDLFASSLADLGRPPVGGLVEPAVELGRVLADRACVLAACGRADEARTCATEALEIADEVAFDGYRSQLDATTKEGPHARL